MSDKKKEAKASSKKTKLTAEDVLQAMEERGFNPSLPFAVLDPRGAMLLANDRMVKLLGLAKGTIVATAAELETAWPFSNEEKSHVAILRDILSKKSSTHAVQAHLKTYKLHAFECGTSICVVAEMLRSGDLLQDNPSRQVLFRTLSHEIRTSLMALEGYLKMLEPQDHDQAHICDRMKENVERLKKVVDRLKDLKVELKD